jgi:carbonic anhydrase
MRNPIHLEIAASMFAAIVLAAGPSAAQHHGAAGHEWSYEGEQGPEHWGDLKAEWAPCRLGTVQSPIDIAGAVKADLPPLEFAYRPVPLAIINNGHTIQVNIPPGSFLTVGGRRFQLVQLHFHHPSEETVGGRGFDMVAHLVHKDADGKLGVVAVLITKGQANALVATLWDHLPAEVGMEQALPGVTVDPAELLPARKGYYTFAGSLTTPPCSEGVTWFVLRTPAELSAAQIERFAHAYPHNARPTQPLRGRIVSESR